MPVFANTYGRFHPPLSHLFVFSTEGDFFSRPVLSSELDPWEEPAISIPTAELNVEMEIPGFVWASPVGTCRICSQWHSTFHKNGWFVWTSQLYTILAANLNSNTDARRAGQNCIAGGDFVKTIFRSWVASPLRCYRVLAVYWLARTDGMFEPQACEIQGSGRTLKKRLAGDLVLDSAMTEAESITGTPRPKPRLQPTRTGTRADKELVNVGNVSCIFTNQDIYDVFHAMVTTILGRDADFRKPGFAVDSVWKRRRDDGSVVRACTPTRDPSGEGFSCGPMTKEIDRNVDQFLEEQGTSSALREELQQARADYELLLAELNDALACGGTDQEDGGVELTSLQEQLSGTRLQLDYARGEVELMKKENDARVRELNASLENV
ncbi:hypothetical protein R1sor_021756 [Riccia sorocarpa]|uniref:Uncharacterized protein n=1 Tax=Riccia sorocarpa TaxID=122646 RepID=A0ABD3GL23_9MARC